MASEPPGAASFVDELAPNRAAEKPFDDVRDAVPRRQREVRRHEARATDELAAIDLGAQEQHRVFDPRLGRLSLDDLALLAGRPLDRRRRRARRTEKRDENGTEPFARHG